MANEIAFKVTGKYEAGPTFARAKKDAEDVGTASEKASRSTKGLGDELDRTGGKAKGFASSLGDGESALSRTSRQIKDTQNSIKALAEEFARTADATERIKITEKLKVERSTLSDLQRLRKELGGLAEDGQKIAGTFAAAFQGGLLETFRSIPGEAKVAIVAGLASVALMAAPLIGATINAALLTGIGAGGIAAGVVLALRDPAILRASGDLGGHILKDLTDAAVPFKSQLLSAFSIFDQSWSKIAPNISGMFDKLAPKVSMLAAGFGLAFEKAIPGIEKAVTASLPLIDALVENLPAMGEAANMFFESLAEGGPGAAKALKVVLLEVEVIIVAIGKTIEYLGKMYDAFAKVAQATGEFLGFADEGKSIARTLDTTTHSASYLEQTINGVIVRTENAKSTMDDMGTVGGSAFVGLDQKMRDALSTIERLNKAFDEQLNKMLSEDEALIRYEKSVDDLTESFKKNGKSLDENTDKGRHNREAVLNIIEAMQTQRDAAIRAGNGTKESYDQANQAFLTQLQSLRAQLKALGANTAEVDKLIARYEQLAKPVTKTVTINIRENVSVSGQGVIAGGDLRRMVGGAYAHGGIPRADSGMVGSGLGGGLVQVSERKREMALLAPGVASLPPGSTILPNSNTEQALAGGGRGGMALVVEVRPGASEQLMDDVVKGLRYRIRYQSGGSAEEFFAEAS